MGKKNPSAPKHTVQYMHKYMQRPRHTYRNRIPSSYEPFNSMNVQCTVYIFYIINQAYFMIWHIAYCNTIQTHMNVSCVVCVIHLFSLLLLLLLLLLICTFIFLHFDFISSVSVYRNATETFKNPKPNKR